jgi:hypothetical protein
VEAQLLDGLGFPVALTELMDLNGIGQARGL